MAIDFPATTGQATDGSYTHTASGITWAWDGTTWKAQGVTNSYTLPTASATVLGGVKVGTGLSINAGTGVLTATGGGGGGATALDGLSDVTINTPQTNQVLKYNGSAWVNDTDATGGGGGAGTPTITWTLTAPNAPNDYTFSGDGFPTSQTDPTLYLIRGQTYQFVNNTGGHPFRIQSTGATAGGGTQYNSGVTNNDAGNGVTLTFVVPMDAPDTLYYQCTSHIGMFGTITILSQGSSTPSRQTFQQQTSSIASGSPDDITITAFKTFALLKIETSDAAWVTLYKDSTSRSADSGRNETTDPLPGSGVLAEVITTGAQTVPITPGIFGWNDDATPAASIYAKVVNKSTSTQQITVTITAVKLEG